MRKFALNKLLRSKLYDLFAADLSEFATQKLTPKEFKKALLEKLQEEVQEVITASNKQEMLQELADVLEVIEALSKAYAIEPTDLKRYQEQKRETQGGFSTPLKALYSICDETDPKQVQYIRYAEHRPERYPELPLY